MQYEFEIYESKIWGTKSGMVLLRGKGIKIKLLIDSRDGFYLEVGHDSSGFWIELSILQSYISNDKVEKLSPEQASKIFKDNFPKIKEQFKSSSLINDLEAYKKRRSNERFSRK